MHAIVSGFTGWLQMRGVHDSRVRRVDRTLTLMAGVLIVLGFYLESNREVEAVLSLLSVSRFGG